MERELRLSKSVLNKHLERWQKAIVRILKTGHCLFIFPFYYNPATQDIKLGSLWRLMIWYFVLFCYGLDLCYLTHISVEVTLENSSEKEFLDFYIHTCSRYVAWFIQLAPVLSMQELVQFLNGLFKMRQRWQNIHRGFFLHNLQITERTEQKIAILSQVTVVFVHLQPLIPLFLHLTSRGSLRYWPARYLNKSVYNFLPFAVFYAFNDLVYSYFAIFGSVYVLVIVISFMALTTIWLTLLW